MAYIDREKVLQSIGDIPEGHISDYDAGRWDVRQKIIEQPTADVVEVKHAHWQTREKYNDYLWVECSNCGFRVENYKAVKLGKSSTDIVGNKWNGCPICLARMDGGTTDE